MAVRGSGVPSVLPQSPLVDKCLCFAASRIWAASWSFLGSTGERAVIFDLIITLESDELLSVSDYHINLQNGFYFSFQEWAENLRLSLVN